MTEVAASPQGGTYTVTPNEAHNWAICGGYYAACKHSDSKRGASYQLDLGIAVHNLVARLNRSTLPAQDLEMFVERNWRPGRFSSDDDARARQEALDMLACYEMARREEDVEILASEWYTRTERRAIGDGLSISLSGRVDRLGKRVDGDIEVLDYKTSSSLPSEAELREDLASTAYHVLAASHHSAKRIIISQWSLRSNARSEVALTPADLTAGKEQLCLMVREIARGEFRRASCEACAYCPAGQVCSANIHRVPIEGEPARDWMDT